MTIEQAEKIRKMLDPEKYHLYCELQDVTQQDLSIVKEWMLFRKHDNWMTDGSKPIMSSETNTYKQLLKFATEHKTYDVGSYLCKFRVIVSFCLLAIVILNVMLIHSDYLSGMTTGMNLFIIFESLIYMKLDNQNFKVKMKERCKK